MSQLWVVLSAYGERLRRTPLLFCKSAEPRRTFRQDDEGAARLAAPTKILGDSRFTGLDQAKRRRPP